MPSFRRRPESSGFKTKCIFVLLDTGLRRYDAMIVSFFEILFWLM